MFIIVTVSSVVIWHFGVFGDGATVAVLYGSLMSLAIVDLRSGYVPNAALVPLSVLAIVHALLSGNLFWGIFGLLSVGGIALSLHVVGQGASFGLGDVKLLSVLGSVLGAEQSLRVLSAAFMIGAVIAIALLAIGIVSRRDAIPFVPILALAYFLEGGIHAG